MKWIAYVLAGVLGLVFLALVLLLAVGGGRGESRLVRTLEISRPAPVVFAWISEPERLKAWVGGLVEIQPLTPPPMKIGSRSVWVVQDTTSNERTDIQTEVTRLETDSVLESRLNASTGFTGTVLYELQSIDANRTHLTYRGRFHYEQWLAKLLEPVMSRSAQRKLDEDLARLKQQVEAP